MAQPIHLIFLSVLFVSLVSLVGVLLLSLNDRVLNKILLYLVSFSTGALLGNVFVHMLPEIVEHSEVEKGLTIVLIGIVLSFILEKGIHWRHCHSMECKTHIHPVGKLMLIGDTVHNVLDGILIATSYLVSIPLGIATTMAVLLHEIPQEIGDFAVLLHSGFTRKKALLFNLFSALTALMGAVLVISLSGRVSGLEEILLPIAAGNFLYIAGSDLIPELHKETRLKQTGVQLFFMIAGIALMYGLALNNAH